MEKQIILKLKNSRSYREFLEFYFEYRKNENIYFSLNGFSVQAGLSSRNFMGQLLKGTRRINHLSFNKILNSLRIDQKLKRHFKLLVFKEEVDLRPGYLNSIDKISEKIAINQQKIDCDDQNIHIPLDREVWRVYAALGSLELGANLEDIALRTGLDYAVINEILKKLMKHNAVTQSGFFYKANNLHLVENKKEIFGQLHQLYLQNIKLLESSAQLNFSSDKHLFFQSCFTVQKNKRPELKKKLLDVLEEFVENSEECEGDDVVDLLLGLY